MKTLMKLLSLAFLLPVLGFAQPVEEQFNPNSINPIAKYEQMYKLRVWRTIDLKEKQNKGFFSNNGEITKLIMDAVRTGEIPNVYENDSLSDKTKMDKQKFFDNMVSQQGQSFAAWDPANTYYAGDIASFNGKNYQSEIDNNVGVNPATAQNGEWTATTQGQALTYMPRDISRIKIVEDVIFDKRRSRLYYDIQAVSMEVFDPNLSFWKPLGWVRYKDLEKVFRNHPKEAVWFNRQNTAENKNFADAFLLRLFKGVIYKIENPDDFTIEDIYRNNSRPYYESVWAREWSEMMLMEKEHNLWEF
jgi:gliding motility associated protien GldN